MKVTVFRTAMCGGGLAYDVYVEWDSAPAWTTCRDVNGNIPTQILRDDGRYLDFAHATVPWEQRAMEFGFDRYDAWNAHEKAASIEARKIADRLFPELTQYPGNSMPFLWATGLVSREHEKHGKRSITI